MIEQLIKLQHKHFKIEYDNEPRRLDAEEENFRVAAMMEELSEFIIADTLEDKYDALLDLMVFTAGTLERMGLPIDAGLKEVIDCNLKKTVGPNTRRGGFKLDLVKPPGWTAPNLGGILDDNNNR